jgi:hypothetical protein
VTPHAVFKALEFRDEEFCPQRLEFCAISFVSCCPYSAASAFSLPRFFCAETLFKDTDMKYTNTTIATKKTIDSINWTFVFSFSLRIILIRKPSNKKIKNGGKSP